MRDAVLIFDNNPTEKVESKNKLKEKNYFVKVRSNLFDFTVVQRVISRIKYIINNERKSSQKINVILQIASTIIADKSIFVLFEIMIYELIKNNDINVKLMTSFTKKDFCYSFYQHSLLYKHNNRFIDKDLFLSEFESKIFIDKDEKTKKVTHFRYLVEYKKDDRTKVSSIITDVGMFLKQLDIQDIDYKDNIKEVIGEILGNALDHAKGDCILDVIIDDVFDKENYKKYHSIIITNVNISSLLLYSTLMKNYKSKKLIISDTIKQKIDMAYHNHKRFLNQEYEEKDFFTLATFQKHVTTRGTTIENSGTGLTKLIEILQNKSLANLCYVITGDRILYLVDGIIKVDNEGMVGFNKENDFLNYPPNLEFLSKCPFYLNGTLFNLAFII